jgi:hypothetical protein
MSLKRDMRIASSPVMVISVVNDFAMYDRFFTDNPNLEGCALHPIDNRAKNETITVRYNRVIREIGFERPRWLMFVHQDFEMLEPLLPKIALLDPRHIFGPYGAKTQRVWGVYYKWLLTGHMRISRRDGGGCFLSGHPANVGDPTETFDCCCFFIHTDWLRRTGFRFDEHLTFDLYGEDLCIQAQEFYHTRPMMLPLLAQHYALHPVPARYYEQEAYLNTKYRTCAYTGQCSHYLGKPNALWAAQVWLKRRIMSCMKKKMARLDRP